MEIVTKEKFDQHGGPKRETIVRQAFPSDHSIVYEIEVINE
tara:strand:- start:374 stop:496 length:123 start_codon:yes stop_codon:yes gene_type:complete